jgi:ABC-type Fe3+/spermidine/putrescine transport system ATPase subunit
VSAAERAGGRLSIEGVTHRYGRSAALRDVSLEVEAGEFVTLLGPSGCGKTTLLRIVAGFVRPSEGRIVLDGRDVTRQAPNRRAVNMVFQRPMMFPHLDVFENVAFGLRVAGLDKQAIGERVAEALRLVRLEGFERRRSTELSGGQMQRISLARALVNRPRILLLDEPLSALDLKIRLEMEAELRRVHRETGATFLYVTHDQGEALALSDRVVVFNHGHVEQVGTPAEIYDRPASTFAAQFVGDANVLPVEIECVEGSTAWVVLNGRRVAVIAPGAAPGAGWLVIRSEAVKVVRSPAGSDDVVLGEISDVAFRGSSYSLHIAVPGVEAPIRAEVPADPAIGYEVGEQVTIGWDADSVSLLARDDGDAAPC